MLEKKPRSLEPPEEFAHLLVWYAEIRAQAHHGQYFEPLSLIEIEAYERYLAKMEIIMEPIEHELLRRLDAIWREVQPEPGK